MRSLQRRPHHRHIPRTIIRKVHPPLLFFHQLLLSIHLLTINKLTRPKLPRDGFFLRVDINRVDSRSTLVFCCLDDSETHGTQPPHSHGGTWGDFGVVGGGTPPGAHATAQNADFVEVGLGVDLGGGDLGDDGVLAEGGTAHEVED